MTIGRVSVGHPVDVGSGAVFTIHTDVRLSGIAPIIWRRYYSTALHRSSFLGWGWTVSYLSTLHKVANGYSFIDENGSEVIFGDVLDHEDRVRNLSANMELRIQGDLLIVTHWHHAMNDITCFGFSIGENSRYLLRYIEKFPGYRVSIQYDSDKRPIRIVQDLEGRGLQLAYGHNNLICSVSFQGTSGSVQPAMHYDYDESDRLIKARDCAGNMTQYSYDGQNRMLMETNPLGSTFSFDYDRQGRCIHSSGNNGYMARRLNYSSSKMTTRVTDSVGNVTQFHLNSNGQVLQEIRPDGSVRTNQYDEYGRLSCVQYPNGGLERYQYDVRGNLASVIDPSGFCTSWVYNCNHQIMQLETSDGPQLVLDYDENSRLLSKSDAVGNKWLYKRHSNGLVNEVVTPEGWRLFINYGDRFQWRQTQDNYSLLYREEYDEFGNEITLSDTEGVIRRIEYNLTFKPRTIWHRNGDRYTFDWNALGKMTKRVAPGNVRDEWGYDHLGQYVYHKNTTGQVMKFEYDSEGRVKGEVDYAGSRSEFEFGPNGQITLERTSDGRHYRYHYKSTGELITIEKPDGNTITLDYDICGRVISRESSDGLLEEYKYDAAGRMQAAITSGSQIEFERDKIGRVIAESQNGFRILYAYDKDGRKVLRECPDLKNQTLMKEFDLRGRLISVSDSVGICQKWSWDNLNRLTVRKCPGGITESFAHDAAGRLIQQKVEFDSPVRSEGVSRQYLYDESGNIRVLIDSRRGAIEFEYDQLSRLTKVMKQKNVEEHYRYNEVDSILETHRGKRTVGYGGRTVTDGHGDVEYDSNGCITSIETPRGLLKLSYDVLDRLIKVSRSDGTEAKYSYDVFGRRILKEVNGKETKFVWEGHHLLATHRDGEDPESYFFMNGKPFAQWQGKDRFTPVLDKMGRVFEVFSEKGELVWAGMLDAMGNMVSEFGKRSSYFRYRGQYFDQETGFHYNHHRYYYPLLCDYISPDPLGVMAGSNFYMYPRNPLRWDDPDGLECDPSHTHEDNFDKAREEAFKKAGMTDPSQVDFSKVDPVTGTVVEFKGPGGAKVAYDTPHASPGPGHDQPHVGWQTGGKRSAGGTERGNITYDGPQHPSRSPNKGEGVLK